SETSAVFNGVAGDRYAFRAVATDLVGFVEDDPGVEEAFTFVDVNDAPTIGLLDRNIPSTEILARSDTFLRPLTLGNDPAGDFLDIGNRTPENNDLFDTVLQLPLAAAGSDVKRIVVQLSTEEVAAGDRLAFGVTDGEHIVAARRLDETVDGGLVQFFQIDNDLIDQTLGRNIATDTGYVETIELELLLRPTETEMIIRFGDTVDSFIGPETLDPNADLNLILVGQRASDAYRIRQLDAIVDGENGTFEIDENLADGTIAVSDLVANDPDTDETFQWSIVSGNDEGAFEIDTNTGVITVSDGTQLDFETNGQFSFNVQLQDGEGLTDVMPVTINLNNVNESPTVENLLPDVTVDEDAEDQTIDISTVFADVDSTDLTITATSDDDSLVTALLDGDNLTLSFTPDASGNATITVTASDGELTATETFTVTVNAVNDAPTVENPLPDVTVDEDAEDQTIDVTNVFADIDSTELTITATSDDDSLVTATLNGDNLTLAFEPDASGNATITVTASDGELTATDTFTVTVNAVNDAPTVDTPLPDVTVDEDAEDQAIDVTNVFADIDSTDLTITAASDDDSLVTATLNGDNLTLAFTPDASGNATITVTASDGELTASDTFSVTVNAENNGDDDPVRLVDGVLIIDGDQDDASLKDVLKIRLAEDDPSQLEVQVTFGSLDTQTTRFALADVQSIQINAGGGDDKVLVAHDIAISVNVDGGHGNDLIKTGSGDDNIVDMFGDNKIISRAGADTINTGDGRDWVDSGSGNDLVRTGAGRDVIYAGQGADIIVAGAEKDLMFGGDGRDFLIGGDHRDIGFGGDGQDILIGGWTAHDNDDDALRAILAEWDSDRSLIQRVRNIWNGSGTDDRVNAEYYLNRDTVFNDGDFDLLFGGRDRDWFFRS
ncbi:MAG: tandem-95 repeat protein, partial [Planctomycetota bacterium]